MKNFLSIIAFSLFAFSSTFANTNPEEYSISVDHLAIFTNANYSTGSEVIEFSTIQPMISVQIYKADGEMTFMLPVRSDNVQINKNIFEKGEYRLGFILEGQGKVHFTTIMIK